MQTAIRPLTVTFAPNTIARVYPATALDDHNVMLDAGTYPVRYLTVDFRPSEPETAYWACADIPATRTHNGARWGKKGDRVTYNMQRHAYSMELHCLGGR